MKNECEKPNPTDKLWRYMDLGKFIHLISSGKLFFASADSFEDPFESAKGTVERKEQWDSFYLNFFRQAIRTAPDATPETLEPKHIEEQAKRLLTELSTSGDWKRQHTFISCWHHNEFESEAMWKLYSVNTKNAVAIQTTAQHLHEALGSDQNILIGKVNYIDYNQRFTSINGACWYKRKSFEHEQEVRAIVIDYETSLKGVLIPVDVNTLLDFIYISPYAPKWFEEVVCSVVGKYGVSCSVVNSDMAKRPFY